MPVLAVVRLNLAPSPAGATVLGVRLAWDDPRDGSRRVLRTTLEGLPAVPAAEWSALPQNPDVAEQVALLMVARAQKEAARAAERGDFAGTRQWLGTARGWGASMPQSAPLLAEMDVLCNLEDALERGHNEAFVKGAKYRSYSHKQSHSPTAPKPPGTGPAGES
jgi:hypothetical protein